MNVLKTYFTLVRINDGQSRLKKIKQQPDKMSWHWTECTFIQKLQPEKLYAMKWNSIVCTSHCIVHLNWITFRSVFWSYIFACAHCFIIYGIYIHKYILLSFSVSFIVHSSISGIVSSLQRICLFDVCINLMLIKIACLISFSKSQQINDFALQWMTIIKWKSDKIYWVVLVVFAFQSLCLFYLARSRSLLRSIWLDSLMKRHFLCVSIYFIHKNSAYLRTHA